MEVSPITFNAACMIDENKIYLSGSLDHLSDVDDEIEYSRLCIYDFEEGNFGWYYHDVKFEVIDVCFYKNNEKILYALGINGEIEKFNGFLGEHSYIDGSGLYAEWSLMSYGYLAKIKSINNKMHVCGYGGQFYILTDCWKEQFILSNKTDDISIVDFQIDHNKNIICIGRIDEQSLLAYFRNNRWLILDLDQYCINYTLYSLVILMDTAILICGGHGILLKLKNNQQIEVLETKLKLDFYSICQFKSIIYIASEQGIYQYDSSGLLNVKVDQRIDKQVVFKIECNDKILWAFTEKYIIRFDGKFWEVIDHPDNVISE